MMRVLAARGLRAASRPPLLGSTRVRLSTAVRAAPARALCTSATGSAAEAVSGGAKAAGFSSAMRARVRVPVLGNLSISEAAGHVAFILAGTAFLDPDILNLRLLSVASGGATLVFAYFHPVGYPLWIPFGWNLAFMCINSGHIYKILTERWEAEHLPVAAVELWKKAFAPHGVSAVDFAKLLDAGTWTTLRAGAVLQEEGRASNSVFVIVRGGADVNVDGERSHEIGSNQFVGDMGLSSGISIAQPIKGIATVTTNQQTTCLVWPRDLLDQLLNSSEILAAAFQAAVAADVMRNLSDPDRENHGDLWRARYASLLEALLESGQCSQLQRSQLEQFRSIHRISKEEHAAVLDACGWTAAQYAEGSNGTVGPAAGPNEVRWQAAPGTPEWDVDPVGRLQRVEGGAGGPSGAEIGDGERALDLWDSRTHAVAAVQERLNAFFGTKALQVDGSYGPLTQQAVELFQVKMGLSHVDGHAGPVTWRLLRQAHRRKLHGDADDALLEIVRCARRSHVQIDGGDAEPATASPPPRPPYDRPPTQALRDVAGASRPTASTSTW